MDEAAVVCYWHNVWENPFPGKRESSIASAFLCGVENTFLQKHTSYNMSDTGLL